MVLADLLALRDGKALALVLPAEHRWPTEGHRQETFQRSDRLLGWRWRRRREKALTSWMDRPGQKAKVMDLQDVSPP